MSNERKVAISALLVALLVSLTLLALPHPVAPARFVLSSWDYPDEYGQGIELFEIQENSTGSWVQTGPHRYYNETTILNWTAGVAMKLICVAWLNSTLTGAGSIAEGKNYQRHNVTVTDDLATVVFTQENFTYAAGWDSLNPPLWMYQYEVVLDFLPLAGRYYTVVVTYEIWW